MWSTVMPPKTWWMGWINLTELIPAISMMAVEEPMTYGIQGFLIILSMISGLFCFSDYSKIIVAVHFIFIINKWDKKMTARLVLNSHFFCVLEVIKNGLLLISWLWTDCEHFFNSVFFVNLLKNFISVWQMGGITFPSLQSTMVDWGVQVWRL